MNDPTAKALAAPQPLSRRALAPEMVDESSRQDELETREQHVLRILSEVESSEVASQRSLARELGIALGLTNLLLRRMIRKGWIRLIEIQPNRVRYLITPAGVVEKARMSRAYFARNVRFYGEARDRIRAGFLVLSSELDNAGATAKRIAFFAAGEVAEIGYICLQDSDLNLVAIADADAVEKRFFGMPIHPAQTLTVEAINGIPFDRLVVMSFDDIEPIQRVLDRQGIPPHRIFWP